MRAEFIINGETFDHECDALEVARLRSHHAPEVSVWMRSGAWAILIARWAAGVQVWPRASKAAAA